MGTATNELMAAFFPPPLATTQIPSSLAWSTVLPVPPSALLSWSISSRPVWSDSEHDDEDVPSLSPSGHHCPSLLSVRVWGTAGVYVFVWEGFIEASIIGMDSLAIAHGKAPSRGGKCRGHEEKKTANAAKRRAYPWLIVKYSAP